MTRPAALVTVVLVALLVGCGSSGDPVVEGGELDATAAPVDGPDDDGDDATPAEGADREDDEASPAPTFAEVCEGRDDEAFIEVLTPQSGAVVTDPITVTGCGNTFEANVLHRLEAADGTVLAEGFSTMSCGNGCVGEFSVTIEAGRTGEVVLTVFEASPQDGSPQHVVEVPLTVE